MIPILQQDRDPGFPTVPRDREGQGDQRDLAVAAGDLQEGQNGREIHRPGHQGGQVHPS